VKAAALAFVLIFASSCGVVGSLRPGPTIVPLISARFLSVRLYIGDNGDAQEKARLPGLRDAMAGALPPAWATATAGRGQLAIRTDADIDVELDGSGGTSALTQHKLNGRVVSRTIAVHTVEGTRRLSVGELVVTALHELGHAIGLRHDDDPKLLMCGRPASCRPDAFQSDTPRFFPLSGAEKDRLRSLYPSDWSAR